MKKKERISVTLVLIIGLALGGCSQSMASSNRETSSDIPAQVACTSENHILTTSSGLSKASSEAEMKEQEENIMKITIGDKILTAVLVDNSSTDALKEILASGPLTIDMSDYGNMEKVGSIGQSLPTNDEQITTAPGDIILYMGNSLAIYYDTNSWNFTRIGKIQDITQEELKEVLGVDNVMVTLSLEKEPF